MTIIQTSPNNLPEKKYIFDVVFDEFLGVNYKLEITQNTYEYVIKLMNNKKIFIKDIFWNKCKEDLEYLSERYLPSKVVFFKNEFTFEPDIPILYGNPVIQKVQDGIECDIDIFATIFFYLTRWEEYISNDKDKFGRFKLTSSFSYKNNLVQRPIVNEYIEMLWRMLFSLDENLKRKIRKYKPVITHDVDKPIRLWNFNAFKDSFSRNLIKARDYRHAVRDCYIYPLNKITKKFDVGNSYDFLMSASESIGVKAHFFFKNSPKTKYDEGYSINSPFLKQTFQKIKSRNHIIGIHPSYYSFENTESWKKEYDDFCSYMGEKIYYGRQHYLRFNVPSTWQLWDENDLKTDFTLGFPEMEGFRCGICYEYSVYNFITRKKLKLKESPLILMEVSLSEYQKIINAEEFIKKVKDVVSIVKKYDGDFVFLWHNSVFNNVLFTRKFYERLIQIIN